MKLILGLGNPESRYDGTRHNVGFWMLDKFTHAQNATFAEKSKFKADVAEILMGNEKVLLAKPSTYYNDSGQSYRAILDFYKISPEDTLIVHDELALPLGTVRTRTGGSDAGNNGVKSVAIHGGETSARIRIGVSNEMRATMGDVDFVLGRLSQDEQKILSDHLPQVYTLIKKFITGEFEPTTHR